MIPGGWPWGEILARTGPHWREPFEDLAPFISHLRGEGAREVLDLGCGAGRNTVALALAGFAVTATDISQEGLSLTRATLDAAWAAARVCRSEMHDFPFASRSFDAVIAVHVIYHTTRSGMVRVLGEIGRVLHPGGWAFLTFNSTASHNCGEGELLEPGTFRKVRGHEAGVPHHFVDEAGVRALLSPFALLRLVHKEEYVEDSPPGRRHAHWIAWVRTPG